MMLVSWYTWPDSNSGSNPLCTNKLVLVLPASPITKYSGSSLIFWPLADWLAASRFSASCTTAISSFGPGPPCCDCAAWLAFASCCFLYRNSTTNSAASTPITARPLRSTHMPVPSSPNQLGTNHDNTSHTSVATPTRM